MGQKSTGSNPEKNGMINETIYEIENDLNKQIIFFRDKVTYEISEIELTLIRHTSLLYQSAEYHYCCAMFQASPGLWAIIAAIVIAVSDIIIFIRYLVSIFHIVEILKVAELLAVIWPQFRVALDKIYGKVSEVSAQLGFGMDGLIHLIQATQSGIAVLGGVLGKDDLWSEAQIGEQALKTVERIASFAHVLERDPSHAFMELFREQDWNNKRKFGEWWEKVTTRIGTAAEKAENAIKKASDLSNSLLELRIRLPEFVIKYIPAVIWDDIEWANSMIDNNLLPTVTNINREVAIINAELQAERERAQALANRLLMPGDLLTNIDSLSPEEKANQELKIDDVTSRLYEKETDIIYQSDLEVIEGLESVRKLAALDLPELDFLSLETGGRPGIFYDPAEKIDGWFVGDF